MVGILSDSHDNLPRLRQAIQIFQEAQCSLVLHAGDFIAPFAARELAALKCPVQAVFGNCDGEQAGLEAALKGFGQIRKEPSVFQHGGLTFLLSHREVLVPAWAESQKYDVIVFGHTHKAESWKKGRSLIVNPGEAGGWLSGRPTVALLDMEKREVEVLRLT